MKLASLAILSLALLFFIVSVDAGADVRPDGRCGTHYGNSRCPQGSCCSIYGWCGTSDEYCRDYCIYQCPPPWWWPFNPPSSRTLRKNVHNNHNNNNAVSKILSESLFNEMFKHRKDCPSRGFYSYRAFIAAAASFPGFLSTGDVAARKKELANFLAQTSQASSGRRSDLVQDPYAWGYCHINTTSTSGDDSDFCTSPNWLCAPGKKYNSRGPFQLTHNKNYALVGKALGIDLIKNPNLVATDPVVSFKTAIWLWMTQYKNKPSSRGSVGYYKRYCDMLGVSYEDDLKHQNNKTPSLDASRN